MAENRTYTIYLSMHPADRYRYWDDLVNHLSADGYTVRYALSPADGDPAALDNVDLILLGVTEKYITWNNSGFVSEALEAMQKHIPILPVMLEAGIVNLFNTRCKKLHYIENMSGSLTQETLASITEHVGRMLDDEISAADDACKPKVFISYRKKDAAALQRLAGLLDAHPQREHITVWYDTNLNPGENYSTTIAQQVASSDLFLMLVTPHILEPDNYIARVEYPMAKRAKKSILPIVMQPTDLAALYALFPDLPKCITEKQIGGVFAKLKR